jgi:predicted small lipoprotein YifL
MMKLGHTARMARVMALALALVAVAACGVDGEPEQPTRAEVSLPAGPTYGTPN